MWHLLCQQVISKMQWERIYELVIASQQTRIEMAADVDCVTERFTCWRPGAGVAVASSVLHGFTSERDSHRESRRQESQGVEEPELV